jgi:ADP-ribose pyrophosphatase
MAYELSERQTLYNGKRLRLELHHLRDEDAGKRLTKEVVVHPGAVAILPFLDDKTILLIRNRRWSIGKILLELPAGTLEPNEPPINCAGRELLEETGYLARKIKPLTTFYTSPGVLSERMHAFAAFQLQKQRAAPEEAEEIEVVPTLLADAIQMIRFGEIQDGKTIAMLLSWERFYAQGDPQPQD